MENWAMSKGLNYPVLYDESRRRSLTPGYSIKDAGHHGIQKSFWLEHSSGYSARFVEKNAEGPIEEVAPDAKHSQSDES